MKKSLVITAISLLILAGVVGAQSNPFDVNTGVRIGTPSQQSDGEIRGTVTQWQKGKEIPLSGATVIIGKNISLVGRGSTDVIRNAKGIAAEVKTDGKGAFSAKAPAGTYMLILWKRGYVPASYSTRVPGSFKGAISADTQVGSSGRHLNLSRE